MGKREVALVSCILFRIIRRNNLICRDRVWRRFLSFQLLTLLFVFFAQILKGLLNFWKERTTEDKF